MAFIQTNNTVGTTVTAIVTVPNGSRQNIPLTISNLDSAAIWVGDSTITTSGATQGYKLAAGGNVQFWLNGGDMVYGISAAGTGAGLVVVSYSA